MTGVDVPTGPRVTPRVPVLDDAEQQPVLTKGLR